MKTISIVVTAFNAARFFGSTVDSILRQSLTAWELVIVDDGSSDQTAALAERYARQDDRIKVVKKQNGGVASARNAGYAQISPGTAYVIFLDHDDVWEIDALETLASALEDDAQASAAFGLGRYIDSAGEITRPGELERAQKNRSGYMNGNIVSWPVDAPTTFDVIVMWSYITTPGQVLIRRAAMPTGDPFDQNVAPADDWDLYGRLSLTGHLRLVDKVVLNYRIHERNASHNTRLMDDACLRVRRKFYRIPGLSNEQQKAVVAGFLSTERDKYEKYRGELNRSIRTRNKRQALANCLETARIWSRIVKGRP